MGFAVTRVTPLIILDSVVPKACRVPFFGGGEGFCRAIARSSNPVLSSAEQDTFLYLVKKEDDPLGFPCEPLRGDIVIVPLLLSLSGCKPRYT